jgi:protein-S-isoprenylcysteine O-methyltransferase Ste14
MPAYSYLILMAGWVVWVAPFLLYKRSSSTPATVDRRARWGILIEALAFALLWQGRFWERMPAVWQVVASVLCFIAGASFSWKAVRALGRHWRVDAGLDRDHELVRAGPYGIVRHPIYTSLLFVLLGTGFLIAPWRLFLAALAIFLIGTRIRVRIEDGLLAARFGEQFEAYRRSVPAFIPFLH